VPPPGATLRI